MEYRGEYEIVQWISDGNPFRVYRVRRNDRSGLRSHGEEEFVVREATLPEDDWFRLWLFEDAPLACLPQHRNIERVVDWQPDQAWWVEKYFIACSAAVALERFQCLTAVQACAIAHAVSHALEHLHGLRDPTGEPLEMIHRNVDIDRVMVASSGDVVLANPIFERLARAANVHVAKPLSEQKFARLSPEQAQGRPVDRRSDVYQIGALLYELLKGRPAFEGTASEVLRAVIEKEPPAIDIEGVSEHLKATIRSSMAKRPSARPRSAAEVAAALEAERVRCHWPDWDETLLELSGVLEPCMTPLGL